MTGYKCISSSSSLLLHNAMWSVLQLTSLRKPGSSANLCTGTDTGRALDIARFAVDFAVASILISTLTALSATNVPLSCCIIQTHYCQCAHQWQINFTVGYTNNLQCKKNNHKHQHSNAYEIICSSCKLKISSNIIKFRQKDYDLKYRYQFYILKKND